MSEYLLVLPIEPVPLGTSYPPGVSLPLHCTLMQWFKTSGDPDLAAEVSAAGVKSGCIELVSLALDRAFGPKANVPVHVLERDEDLNLLHTRLLVLLAALPSDFSELRWIGAGYRPHVSDTEGRSFAPHTRHACKHVALIERDPDKVKTVRKIFHFGASS